MEHSFVSVQNMHGKEDKAFKRNVFCRCTQCRIKHVQPHCTKCIVMFRTSPTKFGIQTGVKITAAPSSSNGEESGSQREQKQQSGTRDQGLGECQLCSFKNLPKTRSIRRLRIAAKYFTIFRLIENTLCGATLLPAVAFYLRTIVWINSAISLFMSIVTRPEFIILKARR